MSQLNSLLFERSVCVNSTASKSIVRLLVINVFRTLYNFSIIQSSLHLAARMLCFGGQTRRALTSIRDAHCSHVHSYRRESSSDSNRGAGSPRSECVPLTSFPCESVGMRGTPLVSVRLSCPPNNLSACELITPSFTTYGRPPRSLHRDGPMPKSSHNHLSWPAQIRKKMEW